ncbi:MAG: DUF72 domain-containing protein [Candidatus Bathyarchaeia archaeon]
MSEDNIVLGTCGWSYKEWEGNFYKIKSGQSKLRAYSRVFKTAEIDSTFYRNPSKGTVMGWLKYSPSDFVFTAKLPKTITHDNMLGLKKNVKADLYAFLDLMRPLQLGGKLACLLIQLPPKYTYNPQSLEDFFKLLDPTFRYAVEFRNVTWLLPETATFRLLERYAVAYTIVDEPLLPPEIHLTTDFAYFRWHGKGADIWFDYKYSEEELDAWAPKVQETSSKVKKVYGYFNNHYHGYAPENCLQLIEKLGLTTEAQKKTRTKNTGKQSELGAFFGQ